MKEQENEKKKLNIYFIKPVGLYLHMKSRWYTHIHTNVIVAYVLIFLSLQQFNKTKQQRQKWKW